MLRLLNQIYNFICLVGWISVQFYTTHVLINNNLLLRGNNSEMFALPIYIVKIIQTVQLFDIFFILVKISKGSILGSFIQIVARLVVAWLYLSVQISPIQTAAVLISWSLADSNRYLYYLKKSPVTTWLRYNGFIVLYPVGVTSEIFLMNNFLLKNQGKISENYVLFVRFCQITIFIGLFFLYAYMFRNRAKAFKKLETQTKTEPLEKKRSISPKRD